MVDRNWKIRWLLKPAVFTAALLPAAVLAWRIVHNDLGVNPVETLNHFTGDWTLRFLLITLAVTPLRRLSGWTPIMRLRRMLGLFAFFYVCLHFLSWIWIGQQFDMHEIVKDVMKRPFITVGFAAFVMLLPLAATSTNAMVRRLGGRRWQALHRLVYAIGVGGIIHYWWLVKSDIRQPLIYGAILSVLLGMRLYWAWQWRVARPPAAAVRSKAGA
jgi:methionine sulfoxide reductase heme-binding subunit